MSKGGKRIRRNRERPRTSENQAIYKVFCCVALVYKSYLFQNRSFTEILLRQFHVDHYKNFSRGCLLVTEDGVENRDVRPGS